jgi:protein-S-isoprenylcysteine O-methyltransferase Ste14
MDTVRHVLGIVLVVSVPPAVAFWLIVHPFARWWRRVPVAVTYAFLIAFLVGLGTLLYTVRDRLLGRDLGWSWWTIGAGLVLYLVAAALSLRCRRQLSLKTFAGVPEVSPAAFPGRLLQDGIFGVIRHPRYASVILGTVGFAGIVNYLGGYVVVAVSMAGLWPVIVAEERELAERFGPAYTAYRARVPALIPRIRR